MTPLPRYCYNKITYQGTILAVQLQIPHMNTQSNMAERRYSAMFSQCHPLPSVIRKDDAMAKRNLKELNLLDDFLFGTLVSHKEFGEAFCRELLQTIFHRNFGKLKVIPQRQYYGDDTGRVWMYIWKKIMPSWNRRRFTTSSPKTPGTRTNGNSSPKEPASTGRL